MMSTEDCTVVTLLSTVDNNYRINGAICSQWIYVPACPVDYSFILHGLLKIKTSSSTVDSNYGITGAISSQ